MKSFEYEKAIYPSTKCLGIIHIWKISKACITVVSKMQEQYPLACAGAIRKLPVVRLSLSPYKLMTPSSLL
jgi:hypothetical protein